MTVTAKSVLRDAVETMAIAACFAGAFLIPFMLAYGGVTLIQRMLQP